MCEGLHCLNAMRMTEDDTGWQHSIHLRLRHELWRTAFSTMGDEEGRKDEKTWGEMEFDDERKELVKGKFEEGSTDGELEPKKASRQTHACFSVAPASKAAGLIPRPVLRCMRCSSLTRSVRSTASATLKRCAGIARDCTRNIRAFTRAHLHACRT
jgi:hypothetical protein